jgi:hypothetical protein
VGALQVTNQIAKMPVKEIRRKDNSFFMMLALPFVMLSVATKNDGNMMKNGQEQRGKSDGAPSRSLAGSL